MVLVHGLAAHRRKPAYAFVADHLAATVNVLSIDLRGHGQSGGRSRLGAEEWRDVHAAVDSLRRRGQRHIVVVGMSLGATAVCHALARGLDVGGAVLISGSARHGDLTMPGMQTLDALWRSSAKRLLWQAISGFRMDDPAQIFPYPDAAELLAGCRTPLLVVHSPDDNYFDSGHALALADGPAGPVTLWTEPPGFGHAEEGLTPAFCARLAAAVSHVVRHGSFPDSGNTRPERV